MIMCIYIYIEVFVRADRQTIPSIVPSAVGFETSSSMRYKSGLDRQNAHEGANLENPEP